MVSTISTFLTALCLASWTVAHAADTTATNSPPPTKELPLPGEVMRVADHTAFVIAAQTNAGAKARPWVWYAPTLPGLPGGEERWMVEQFTKAGIARACGAYHLAPEELQARLAEHNPIDRLAPLASAQVPLFAIHGDADTVVPLDTNSGEVRTRYQALGGKMRLIIPPGQGHNMWSGFFQCQELVAFVLANAQPRENPGPGSKP